MSETNEDKILFEEQDNFNRDFLVKFMIFMFVYRFYSMHVDPDGELINYVEKTFNDLETEEKLLIDDLD